jgi:hypothetical protein
VHPEDRVAAERERERDRDGRHEAGHGLEPGRAPVLARTRRDGSVERHPRTSLGGHGSARTGREFMAREAAWPALAIR